MGAEDMMKYGDFVEVNSERLKEAGLNIGDRLFIAGTRPLPENKEDPYWLRMKFLCCPLVEDHVQSEKFIMVDPRNVQKLSKTQQKKLNAILHNDFDKDAPKDEALN